MLRKLKLELPCDPLVELYPKEMKTLAPKDSHSAVFIAELFIVAKRQKQPKCLSVVQ